MKQMNSDDKEYYEFIKSQEPQISSHMLAICSKLDITLAGFENRIKSESSLVEKLYQRDNTPVPIDSLKDICRYTMLIPKENYAEIVRNVMQIMSATEQRNIKFKNSWNTEGQYQGINAAFQTGDVKYELQFHTTESYMTKHRCHKIYELERICKDIKQKLIYNEKQKSYFLKVPIPEGAMQLSLKNISKKMSINKDLSIFDSETLNIEATPLLDYLDSEYGQNEKDFQTIANMRGLKTLALTKKQIQLILENKITPTELYIMQKCSTGDDNKELNPVQKNKNIQQSYETR